MRNQFHEVRLQRDAAEREGESSQTFLKALAVVGGVLFVSVVCMAVYTLVIAPIQRENKARSTQRAIEGGLLDQSLTETAAALNTTPGPAGGAIFADVPASYWARGYIEELYKRGYASGCQTDPLMFCPEKAMTRAESAVLVIRGLYGPSYEPMNPLKQTFVDVPLDFWGARWIQELYDLGHTAGCVEEPLSFCPNAEHSRAEGTVFFLRMLRGVGTDPPEPQEPIFADVPLGAWYTRWVHAAHQAGLVLPCETETALMFCPEEPLTRSVAAYMMAKARGWEVQ